jgi:hypothetical protein
MKVIASILTSLFILVSAGFCYQLGSISAGEAHFAASNLLIYINKIPLENKIGEYSIKGIEKIDHKGFLVAEIFHLNPRGHIVISAIREMAPVKSFSVTTDFDSKSSGYESIVLNDLKKTTGFLLSYQNGENPLIEEAIESNYKEWQNTVKINLKGVILAEVKIGAREDDPEISNYILESPSGDVLNATVTNNLLWSKWGQRWPYNDDCPQLAGLKCVTGCVATAGAQVLKYYSQPHKGKGKKSYQWTTGGRELRAKYSDSYDWKNMRNTTEEYGQKDFNYSQRKVNSVAEIFYEVGVGVDMSYGANGSAANSYQLEETFEKYFKYDKRLELVFRNPNYIKADKWFNLFKKEIDNHRPVIFRIASSNGLGHCVVVDGYKIRGAGTLGEASKMVHINMGWEGSQDAYYRLNKIPAFELNNSQYMLKNIKPKYGIVLRNPRPNQNVNKGHEINIRWLSWSCSGNVVLELFKGNKRVKTISEKTENSGKYSWKVPRSLTTGSNYRIKITDKKNSKCCYWGDLFRIH